MHQVPSTFELHRSAPRLFYLGFAFPPGVAALNPGLNPAGHALETQMVAELRRYSDLRSAGLLPLVPPHLEAADPTSGVAHDVILLEKAPELFYRLHSLARLKREYRRWQQAGWEPEAVLVYNLSPVYNSFLLWLRRQPRRPKLVLLLLDSATLGQPVSQLKQFRRRLKPMYVPDAEMILHFDACAGLSRTTSKYFRPRNVPFLWMPGGCTPGRALKDVDSDTYRAGATPIRFGYFGALADHAGVKPLVETFLSLQLPATLALCGYGKMSSELADLARHNTRLKFEGLLSPAAALRFGSTCDVLINPRPLSHGNENNFASKLFDYAMCGKSILTAKLSGVEAVLGPEAFYFDPRDFNRNLGEKLLELAATPRGELLRRGLAIQERVLTDFSWEEQGARLARFVEGVCARQRATPQPTQALAA